MKTLKKILVVIIYSSLITISFLNVISDSGSILAKIILVVTAIYGICRLALFSSNPNNKKWGIIIFWLYCVCLTLLPAVVQLSTSNYFWEDWGGYDKNTEALAAFLLCLGIFTVDVSYKYFSKTSFKLNRNAAILNLSQTQGEANDRFLLSFFILISAVWTLYLIATLGASYFIGTRAAIAALRETIGGPQFNLVITFNSAFLISLLLWTFRNVARDKLCLFNIFSFLIVLSLNSVFNYPGRLPRYILLGTLLCLFIIYVNEHRKKIDVGFALITLFPVFVYIIFRFLGTYNRTDEFNFNAAIANILDFDRAFLLGDYADYQMTILSVRYVAEHGYTFGKQLLGAVFFFIPRSIWEGKADPTNYILAVNEAYTFLNISSPIYLEGYIDFGIIGLLLYSICIGYLLSKSDYYVTKHDSNLRKYLLSVSFIAFLPIILRGSLLAIIGFIASLMFFNLLITIKRPNLRF